MLVHNAGGAGSFEHVGRDGIPSAEHDVVETGERNEVLDLRVAAFFTLAEADVCHLGHRPDRGELEQLLVRLDLRARDLLRKGEADYRERQLSNPDLDDADLIEAMVECPKLIERPIVIRGERAVVGRPPENVLVLLDE